MDHHKILIGIKHIIILIVQMAPGILRQGSQQLGPENLGRTVHTRPAIHLLQPISRKSQLTIRAQNLSLRIINIKAGIHIGRQNYIFQPYIGMHIPVNIAIPAVLHRIPHRRMIQPAYLKPG